MREGMPTDLGDFQCLGCQACCRETGYVRLVPGEPEAIALFLGMDLYEFTGTYTRVTRDRQALSLTEQPGGACVFLTPEGCRIQAVKPRQCRDFPHAWRFSGFENICGWAKARAADASQRDGMNNHMPRMPSPSSSSK